jgi:hypothetical protein
MQLVIRRRRHGADRRAGQETLFDAATDGFDGSTGQHGRTVADCQGQLAAAFGLEEPIIFQFL